jgi:hypothetical protein
LAHHEFALILTREMLREGLIIFRV